MTLIKDKLIVTSIGPSTRLDLFILENFEVSTRQKASALIIAGYVFVNNIKVTKAGAVVKKGDKVLLNHKESTYVGRGGDKIAPAFKYFGISPKNKVCIDVGSSTGGFTDYMLQNGAKKVYAIDSGTNQLDYKLRVDERVDVREKTNARYIKPYDFDPRPELAVIDVSFIGLDKIIPPLVDILVGKKQILALVKPQFELEKKYIAKGGVVKDPKFHQIAIDKVISLAQSLSLKSNGHTPCEIKGQKKGNQEFFVYLSG